MLESIWLLKHLRTLHRLLITNNEKELQAEVETLKTFCDKDNGLIDIIQEIKEKKHGRALELIENKIVAYSDTEEQYAIKHKEEQDIVGLQTIAQLNQIELSVLHYRKAELNKLISGFRLMHQEEVGTLISKVLELRKKLLLKKLDENPDKQAEYEEAKQDYENFENAQTNEHGEIKKPREKLDADKEKQLQVAFRKASKLCHPDIVAEGSKKQAEEIFIELSNAYVRNNLQRVTEILELLESGNLHLIGITDSITEKERLQSIVATLENNIRRVKIEIGEIELSDVYQTIKSITDWNEYFYKLSAKLEREIQRLKQQYEEK